jgi:hypothetical protein
LELDIATRLMNYPKTFKSLRTGFFFLLFILFSGILQAQELEKDSLYDLFTHSRKTVIGRYLGFEKEQYYFLGLKDDSIHLAPKDIIRIKKVGNNQIKYGKYYRENLHRHRYFLCPSAYTLKKGQVYFQNSFLLINQIGIGLTDFFMVNVGTIPSKTLFDGNYNLYWGTIRLSLPLPENLPRVSIGLMTINHPTSSSQTGFANQLKIMLLPMVQVTFGSRENSFSIGLLRNISSNGIDQITMLNGAGRYRISPKVYLINETYIAWEGGYDKSRAIFSTTGIRLQGRSVGFDLGLGLSRTLDQGSISENEGIFPYPYLGISWALGRK